jgi:hypothetical protein
MIEMSATQQQPIRPAQTQKTSFALVVTAIALASFGVTMLLFIVAYVQDLAVLANAPFAVWSALCGQPSDNPLTLSVLIVLSGFALLSGLGAGVVAVARRQR